MSKRTQYVLTPLVKQIADVAEKYGVLARHIPGNQYICTQEDIDPEDLSEDVVAAAETHNGHELWKTLKRLAHINKGYSVDDPPPTPQTDFQELFDLNLGAVLRWMGRDGWEIEETMNVLSKLGVYVSRVEVYWQLKLGRAGKKTYAEPPKKQREMLYRLAE